MEGTISIGAPGGLTGAETQQDRPSAAVLMDVADRALLNSVRQALAVPFRCPVRVSGQLMPRKLARTIERGLAKLQLAERRAG